MNAEMVSVAATTEQQAKMAYVYIRQSSLMQVTRHAESTDLQYSLVKRPHPGWNPNHCFRDPGASRDRGGHPAMARVSFCPASVAGQISPQDPDSLILSAHWVEEQAALEHLGMDSGYDGEPLRHWLCGEAAPGIVYTVKVK